MTWTAGLRLSRPQDQVTAMTPYIAGYLVRLIGELEIVQA